jgi:hypothetical protein
LGWGRTLGNVQVNSQPWRTIAFFGAVIAHFALSAITAIIIGLPIEARFSSFYKNSWIEPLSPCTAVVAGLLGFLVARWWGDRRAFWVWVAGLVWFVFGLHESYSGWSPAWFHETRAQYTFDTLLGPGTRCSGSECLGELIFTAPLVCSVAYSVCAWVTLRKVEKSPTPESTT